MHIIQIGLGGVGRELCRQLIAQREPLARRYGVSLNYRAVADSSGALAADPLDPSAVLAAAEAKAAGRRLADLPGGRAAAWPELLPAEPCIIVDVSAADGHAAPLAAAVAAGHRVVLANKKPLTDSYALFEALAGRGATRYEATVGAGLPVIATLRGLLDAGDTIVRVEAALSGTLGYLCTELQAGRPLSAAVREAHRLGYTEPDPRDDLSGADVARKALILARTCGLSWAPDAVRAEPWFPPELGAASRDGFMARLEELDAGFAARVAAAAAAGGSLRYRASITPEGAEVGLVTVPADHPLASLRGPDNLISFTTDRYPERPLVVRGPGAGLAVTAAGVLADIIATARELG